MSKKNRQHARAAAAVSASPALAEPRVAPVAITAPPSASGSTVFSFGVGQGHNAADSSLGRGMIYFPQLDTRREITSMARTEILRKSRYMYANVGFARRCVNGVARMVVGTGLMPRPATRAREWNQLAQRRIDARYASATTWDLAGRLNGYTSQLAKLRCSYRDGDVGTALTFGVDGTATQAVYEAHQIGNGSNVTAAEALSLFDGVRLDQHRRALGVRVLRDDGTAVEIPAASFPLLGNFERLGQTRGLPIIAHAIPHLHDKIEIDRYFKGSIKASARQGYYIGKAAGQPPTSIPRPGGTVAQRTVTTSTGQRVNLGKVFSEEGGEVEELEAGQEIKMLLDQRPHPNTLGFLEYLIRDISLGIDLSPEILWSVVKLGGANMRFVMADAQSFVEQQQQNAIDSTLGLEYIWIIADEIASGRLPPCPDPQWWAHAWIPPARWTVDIGRDGKLQLDQLRSGALTFNRFYGMQGLDANEQLNDWLDEYRFIHDGAVSRGLDPEKVIAAIYGRGGVQTPTEPSEPEATTTENADAALDTLPA